MNEVGSLPIFINCRDRVTPLRDLVAWLERAGHQRIILVDNDSTYEPLLEFYEQSPHEVVRLGQNLIVLTRYANGDESRERRRVLQRL